MTAQSASLQLRSEPEGVRAAIESIVDGLPQREQIRPADRRAWIDEVIGVHGEAAKWHAIRLNGFGGSEIGVLVRNLAGVRADHGASAHDIVESKLMRRVPEEETAVLRRGHDNEPLHAARFYEKYGVTRHVKAFAAVSAATGPRPWMRYSPDDVVYADPGARLSPGIWLIDYKAPTQVDDSDEIKFQYACQLHQGAMMCAALRIDLTGAMLSQFDWAKWCLKDDVIDFDRDLARAILSAGDHYWDCVLKGEVPAYVGRRQLAGVEDLVKSQAALAERVARLKALHSALGKELKSSDEQLKSKLKGVRLGGSAIDFGALRLSAAQSVNLEAAIAALGIDAVRACAAVGKRGAPIGEKAYDDAAIRQRLSALGVDLAEFEVREPQSEQLYRALAQAGHDADSLVMESLRATPVASITRDAQAWVQQQFPALAQAEQTESTEQAPGAPEAQQLERMH